MTPESFQRVSATYLENWSEALCSLSVRQTGWPLTKDETEVLALCSRGSGKILSHTASRVWARVAARLDGALAAYPRGACVRLGSRSGKDSRAALAHGLRVLDGTQALRVLADGSRRVAYDLSLALRYGYCPYLFVREWQNFPAWAEFRCFMRERRLIGISHYTHSTSEKCAQVAAQADTIRAAIDKFFDSFRRVIHLNDVVFDVFLRWPAAEPEVKLMEINPFGPRTNPCRFTWQEGGDFDGSFRY